MKKEYFFDKYRIDSEAFKKTRLRWNDLMNIFEDYSNFLPQLESTAVFIFNNLMKIPGVHSVRYRIKDPEHLIEKIVRKRIENPKRSISLLNYKNEITDLIGIRALHLFKEDWKIIHKKVTEIWKQKEDPIAYHRKGDSDEYLGQFKSENCILREHKYGYRSIHYIIETNPTKETYIAEIQVRTIFEEAWSEIDHTIRYPYNNDHKVFKEFLLILNRLAGSADEMGTFIRSLQHELDAMEKSHAIQINERDAIINELEDKLKNLNLKEQEINKLNETIQKLKADNSKIIGPLTSFSSSFDTIRTISGSLEFLKPVNIVIPQVGTSEITISGSTISNKEVKDNK